MNSLWPDPIITPQELLDARIKHVAYAVLSAEMPQAVVDELQQILDKMRVLNIGGRTTTGEHTEASEQMERFAVKHYTSEKHPVIIGNGFQLEISESRDEAEQFINFVNRLITTHSERESKIKGIEERLFDAVDCTQMIDNTYNEAVAEKRDLKAEITKILQGAV